MAPPSEEWIGFADLDPGSEKYERVKRVLSSANFEHLKRCATDSRRRHQTSPSPDIDCDINLNRFATGFLSTKTSLLSEIATMNIVRQRTSIPVPRIFEFEISTDGPFGYPFVLMEYLGGRQLDTGLTESIPRMYHPKVAKQLANVLAKLQNLTFSRIGRLWCGEAGDQPVGIIPMGWHHSPGPLETSLEYFYNQRRGENREIIAFRPNDADWLTACWVLKTALAHTVIEDRVRGPFPLCHLDLHYGNLLFDEEYNLTGVLDWSNAQAAPLEQLSVCPELVIFPGRSDEDNKPIVEFKELVVQFVKEKEDEKTKEEGKSEESMSSLDLQQGNKEQSQDVTPLSTYMASESAELMHRQYMASPKGSLWAAKRIAKLIYGSHITWEQLREVYGCMPLL
ncbi:kinase-like domain-containing protein [Triangularia verruculosa]|uniref:Kinase-like domain-containing protein n=1 Tax=Triangularia verruculosa TaxID=2587418 RepID=A0AAN6XJ30_9PEZI|nr:kinase-like domain-containing protein [Triangularia verruculosa]